MSRGTSVRSWRGYLVLLLLGAGLVCAYLAVGAANGVDFPRPRPINPPAESLSPERSPSGAEQEPSRSGVPPRGSEGLQTISNQEIVSDTVVPVAPMPENSSSSLVPAVSFPPENGNPPALTAPAAESSKGGAPPLPRHDEPLPLPPFGNRD